MSSFATAKDRCGRRDKAHAIRPQRLVVRSPECQISLIEKLPEEATDTRACERDSIQEIIAWKIIREIIVSTNMV